MSDEEFDSHVPETKRGQLTYSITNLWEMWGQTDSVGFGLVVNGGLAAIGLAVYFGTSGILSFIGAMWAAINLFGIVKWVIQG